MRSTPSVPSNDRGSALAEFVLVGTMLTLLFLAVLQLAIDLHVRDVLQASAADGARYGANADVASPSAALDRALAEVHENLGSAVRVAAQPAVAAINGAPVVVVTLQARLPTVFGLLPAIPVRVVGRALLERP